MPPSTHRLSVIIPCHDVVAYVAPMLASLRRNAGPGIQFLLVDDASGDGTGELLADAVDHLAGAELIRLPTSVGVSAARNRGLASATGEYLTFLDGDDFVAPGYFAELLAAIEELGCEVLRTDHVRVTGRERSVHRIHHGPRGVVASPRDAILPVERPSSVDVPNVWAGIYHRRVLEAGLLGFDEDLRTCEDRLWSWRWHLGVESFAVVGLTGLFYRRGVTTSLTQVGDERQLDFLPAYDKIVATVLADRDAERFLPKAIRSYCAVICHHVEHADRHDHALRQQLRQRCRDALARLQPLGLDPVVARLDPERSRIITALQRGHLRSSGRRAA